MCFCLSRKYHYLSTEQASPFETKTKSLSNRVKYSRWSVKIFDRYALLRVARTTFFYRNTDPLSVGPVLLAALTPPLAHCTSTLRSARTVYSRVHYSRNKRWLFAALTTMHCPVKWWLSVNCEAGSKISVTLDIQPVNSMDPPSKKMHLNTWRRTTLGYNKWQIQFWRH